MRKLHALFIVLLLILLISNNISLFSMLSAERENVLISRVIDGDTVQLSDGRILRLANINSPEKSSPLSKKAADFLKRYENSSVDAEIIEKDKYGRFVARIYAPEYVNAEIVSLGLASKFLVHDDEKDEFSRIEERAMREQRGIWQHSPYFQCFSIKVYASDEIARIEGFCNISLSGFYIKDESRKTYKFLNTSVSSVELITGYGADTSGRLYWHSPDVWNNDRDSAYLFDSEDLLAAYHSYGY